MCSSDLPRLVRAGRDDSPPAGVTNNEGLARQGGVLADLHRGVEGVHIHVQDDAADARSPGLLEEQDTPCIVEPSPSRHPDRSVLPLGQARAHPTNTKSPDRAVAIGALDIGSPMGFGVPGLAATSLAYRKGGVALVMTSQSTGVGGNDLQVGVRRCRACDRPAVRTGVGNVVRDRGERSSRAIA